VTDRANGFVVALEADMRVDDAEAIANAIRQLRGVIAVKPMVTDGGTCAAVEQARAELRKGLIDVLWPKEKR